MSSLMETKGSYMIILRFFSIMFSFIDTEEDFYCVSYFYFEIDVCLKGNERKRKRDSNVSEKAEGSKKEEGMCILHCLSFSFCGIVNV